jgi:N-acetylneuraminic acid mutarotase
MSESHCQNFHLGCIPLFAAICFLSIISGGCEEEKPEPRSYPRIKTLPVTNISENGAVFNGEIYITGDEPIKECGFVWSYHSDPNLNSSDRIKMLPEEVPGRFSAIIPTTLTDGTNYKVRAYLKTEKHLVYGQPVTFDSQGSMAPVINDFTPDSARWGDTLIIKGTNFSYLPYSNQVYFNDIRCPTLKSTDSTIFVSISPYVSSYKNKIKVKIVEDSVIFGDKEFKLLSPAISSMSPINAFWQDTITMVVKNISFEQNPVTILIDSKTAAIYYESSDSIRIIIPNNLTKEINKVIVKVGLTNLYPADDIILKPPIISSFTPTEGTWAETVVIKGLFHANASGTSILFGTIAAGVVSSSRGVITVKVPAALKSSKSKIVYKAPPFTVSSADDFTMKPPVIKSFSPLSGASGTIVTIKGKYFGVTKPIVKFGERAGTVINFNDSTINVRLYSIESGPVKVSVTQFETATSDIDFNITNPKLTSVYPLTGTFNDEITIEGENLTPPSGTISVNFGNIPATIVSSSNNKIVVGVPVSIDSIPRLIQIISGDITLLSEDKFVLSPLQVLSVSPETLVPGQDITITGYNFNPQITGNIVKWGIYYPFNIKSCTTTEIIATCTDALVRGEYNIHVTTGGYTRTSPQKAIVSSSAWTIIPSPAMNTNSANGNTYEAMSIYGANIRGNGFFCSPASNLMYKFDPSDNSWKKIFTSAPFYLTAKMGLAVVEDTIYLIGGRDYTSAAKNTYAFNEILNDWKVIINTTTARGLVSFSLHNKVYIGFHYWSSSYKDLFVFDPSVTYSLTKLSDMQYSIVEPFTTYFSLKDKGYVLFSNNDFFEYDPESGTWLQKEDFPGHSRTLATSFCAGDFAYMGTGISGSTLYNDIWKYDPTTDSWNLVGNIPIPRHSAVSLILNNKVYIGYGVSGSTQLTDFYEFDLNYSK